MWKTLEQAGQALLRDGWVRETPYWWHKQFGTSPVRILLEVEERETGFWPIEHCDEELNAESGKWVQGDIFHGR
jgi:hypothetical protein